MGAENKRDKGLRLPTACARLGLNRSFGREMKVGEKEPSECPCQGKGRVATVVEKYRG